MFFQVAGLKSGDRQRPREGEAVTTRNGRDLVAGNQVEERELDGGACLARRRFVTGESG